MENTTSWYMNQVLENEWGERCSSIQGAIGTIAQNNWNSQVGENGTVYFSKMPCHGDKLNLCKWLVSKILHSAPISRMTLASLGPTTLVKPQRHVSIVNIAMITLHYNHLFTCLLHLKARDIFTSHHPSVWHLLLFQWLNKSWMNENLTKTAKALQGSPLLVVSNDTKKKTQNALYYRQFWVFLRGWN